MKKNEIIDTMSKAKTVEQWNELRASIIKNPDITKEDYDLAVGIIDCSGLIKQIIKED
jgi:hypothetical protein